MEASMRPVGCTEAACAAARAHVAVATLDGPVLIATFYGHLAFARAEEFAQAKAPAYHHRLTVVAGEEWERTPRA